ncbi:ZMYM1 protein, partial [Polyodon spathula]|nr:ZMYM1 protein [Polyodon spathula]
SRRFRAVWYEIHKWLAGSAVSNKVYCWPCLLQSTKHTAWSCEGYSNWKNLSQSTTIHSSSSEHVHNELALKQLENESVGIDRLLDEQSRLAVTEHNEKVRKNREVLKRLIDITMVLSKQEQAFCGYDESEDSLNKGNYPELFEYFFKHEPELKSHWQKNAVVFSGLSKTIQNDLIECMAEGLASFIDSEIMETPFFVCELDEATDVTQRSQLSMVLRYIDFAHKLNLVLQQGAQCIKETHTFFATLEGLSAFFSRSIKRTHLMDENTSSVERSFSCLKHIKTYLRRAVGPTCLSALSLNFILRKDSNERNNFRWADLLLPSAWMVLKPHSTKLVQNVGACHRDGRSGRRQNQERFDSVRGDRRNVRQRKEVRESAKEQTQHSIRGDQEEAPSTSGHDEKEDFSAVVVFIVSFYEFTLEARNGTVLLVTLLAAQAHHLSKSGLVNKLYFTVFFVCLNSPAAASACTPPPPSPGTRYVLTRPMSGSHPCIACNASIPQEDNHSLCMRCLGVPHATMALEREWTCSVCEALQSGLKEVQLERAKRASSASSTAGSPGDMNAPDDVFQAPLSGFPNAQAARSRSASPQARPAKRSKRHYGPQGPDDPGPGALG